MGKWKYEMRERLACLMQKIIRKMIGKNKPPTFIEASENKKAVCLTEACCKCQQAIT